MTLFPFPLSLAFFHAVESIEMIPKPFLLNQHLSLSFSRPSIRILFLSLPLPFPQLSSFAAMRASLPRVTMGTHPGLTQRCLGLKWGIRVGRGPVRVRHRTTRGVQANDLFPFPLSLSPRFFYAVRVH